MDPDDEDQRLVELSSLQAIYPELEMVGDESNFTFRIEVPVNPATPVIVTFPAASTETTAGAADIEAQGGIVGGGQIDSHELAFLPSLLIQISLPNGYPAEHPLGVEISSNPQWLPPNTVRRLQEDGPRLWDDMGRDLVAFSYIDHIQQLAEDVFGLADATRKLEVDPAHKISILDYDIKARRAAFEKETYTCGVCLDNKKGNVCYKLSDCGHVFCRQCLQDFYNNAINQGDLKTVQCLEPNCAKKRADAQASSSKRKRRPRTFISPSELLQIGLSEDTVRRYVKLKYKTELESDKNTVYCPRIWCGGAARSKKHRRPDGLQLTDADDASDDEDAQADSAGKGPAFSTADLLSICEDCGYAFCSRCRQSWHGEFVRCVDKRTGAELSPEEKASAEYLHLHTTPCPTCSAPAQKTQGCNHMICFCCDTHFCYLCSAWLDPVNPYQHFNKPPNGGKITSCYMRLWELGEGDGDDVGLGYVGGGRPRPPRDQQPVPRAARAEPPRAAPLIVNIVPEIEEPDDDDDDGDSGAEDDEEAAGDGGRAVGVAREGPLVLRIAPEPPPPGRHAARAPVPPPAPVAPGIEPGHHGAAGFAGRGGRGHGAGAGAARGGEGGRGRHPVNRGAQRGRGNRGIVGPRGRGAHRQNAQENERGVGAAGDGEMFVDLDGLDPNQAAWIRRFVALALRDEEDDMAD